MLFSNVLQPPVISLFSSTSSHPLLLATPFTSTSLTSDSFISLLLDSDDSNEQLILWHGKHGTDSRTLKGKGKEVERGNLRSVVLHLQGPDVKGTSVRWGALAGRKEDKALGITLPYVHFAVKDLGQMFYVDVGVLDDRGQLAVVRVSTFQASPRVTNDSSHPPLLHLPLRFPPPSPHRLTPWSTLTLHLPFLLSSFAQFGPTRLSRFASIQSIEVHANCRLRRVWCTEEGGLVEEGMALRGMMSELALYEAEQGE